MIIRLLVLAIFFLLPFSVSSAQSSFWVESMNTMSKTGDVAPQVNISGTHNVSKKLSVFIWSLNSSGWGEGIVGMTYSPKAGIEMSLGVGVEKNVNPGRMQGALFLAKHSFSIYTAAELGGSGYWYLVQPNWNLVSKPDSSLSISKFGVGIRAQRFAGIGPRAQVVFLRGRVMAWVVPIAIDPEVDGSRNAILAVRLNY